MLGGFFFLSPLQADIELVKEHYIDLKDKPFYPGACSYISSAPVFPMVWEGLGVIKTGRNMLGETDPVSYFSGDLSSFIIIYHHLPAGLPFTLFRSAS